MSSTNRGANRVPLDQYMTPVKAVQSLVDALDLAMVKQVSFVEPCRGTGNIYHNIPAKHKSYAEIREGFDYRRNEYRSDLVITNPPFVQALEFLEKSLREADTVVYLLRLNFLGSKKRKPFWNTNPPTHVLTLSDRPAFVWACKGRTIDGEKKKGCKSLYQPGEVTTCPVCGGNVGPQTDSIEYAWFAWDRLRILNLPAGIHVL